MEVAGVPQLELFELFAISELEWIAVDDFN